MDTGKLDRMDADLKKALSCIKQYAAETYTGNIYVHWYRQGFLTCETANGINPTKHQYREVIPVSFDVSRSVRKLIRHMDFTFTSNQCFRRVVNFCAESRDTIIEDAAWIRGKTKNVLYQLRACDMAHSIEVYQNKELVSGILGIQIGGFFVGLSVFSSLSGSGNAAFIALLGILSRQKFDWIDAITPSPISRHFGGFMVTHSQFQTFVDQSANKVVSFPTFRRPIPIAQYVQSLLCAPKNVPVVRKPSPDMRSRAASKAPQNAL
jgi:leucyl/phenylalanyl-tRNA--protein transferase